MTLHDSPQVRMAARSLSTLLMQPADSDRRTNVHRVITALDHDAQQALVQRCPELLGRAGGAPLPLRFQANSELLTRARDRAMGERDAIDLEIHTRRSLLDRTGTQPERLSHREFRRLSAAQAQRARINARVENLDRLLEPRPGIDGALRARQYLRVDLGWSVERGVVEVLGDVTTASNIAVLVPGIRQNTDAHRVTRAKAERLYRECCAVGESGSVAVVAWSGYATPPTWVRGASSAAARAAGPQLAEDLASLRAQRTAALTVIGHCYGGRVAMHAGRVGAPIDNLVLIGHLGMDRPVQRRLPRAETLRVFSLNASGDHVRLLRVLGRDPGARALRAIRLDAGTEVRGHLDYWREGSLSLRNQARVVIGDPSIAKPVSASLLHPDVESAHELSRVLERAHVPQFPSETGR